MERDEAKTPGAGEQPIRRRDFLRGAARTAAVASIGSALGGGLIGWALDRGGAAYAGSQGSTIPGTPTRPPTDGSSMSIDPKPESARTPQRGGHDLEDHHVTRTPTATGTPTATTTPTPTATICGPQGLCGPQGPILTTTSTPTLTVTPTASATPCGPQGPQGPQGICGPQGPQGLVQPGRAIA